MRVPKEHGAWAMLYVPFGLGVLAAGSPALEHGVGLALLLGSVTGLFLGRESALAWWRGRDRGQDAGPDARAAAWQLGGALLCAAALLALRPPVGPQPPLEIVPLGCFGAAVLWVHTLRTSRREARTVTGQILAILALTCAAPAAYLVARGEWSLQALSLWALSALFFASSVFHVKVRVLASQQRRAEERDRMRRASAVYHGGLLLGLVTLAATGRLHWFVVLAFLPVVVRALVALGLPPGRADLTRAGVLEVVYSLGFLLFVTLATARG